jgi:aldehyde:ferredoxin oxidoreductase
VKVSDESGLKEIVRELLKEIREKPPLRPQFSNYGTLESHETINKLGILPSRNWQNGVTGHIEAISLENFLKFRIKKHMACYRCPVMCTNTFVIDKGEYAGKATDGPEYESVAALGGMMALRSPEAVIYANQLCNDLGLDTISTGCAIAFGQECFEKGYVTKEFAGFEDLSFANNESAVEMIKRVAYRKGEFARLLGEGVKIASERIGRGSEEIAVEVKGLEPGMYDPRGAIGMALVYAISNRGACHHTQGHTVKKEMTENTRFDTTNKGKIVKDMAQYRILVDTLTFCGHLTGHMGWKISSILEVLTGKAFSNEELKTISDRVNTLERLYLVREGVSREEDSLPLRFQKDPLPEGMAEGKTVKREDLGKMLDEYYSVCGWDERGIPTEETLKKFNLKR